MSSSTRKRTNGGPTSFADNPNPTNPSDLPPDRPRKKPLRKVSPPLSRISLDNLIYILVLGALLLTSFYAYRTVQYKSQVGGWWNLMLGKRPPQLQNQDERPNVQPGGKKWWAGGGSNNGGGSEKSKGNDVEDRINALAEALGMPPKELASAIAGAVKEYVPPASLSSVSSAAAKETGKNSDATKILLGEDEEAQGVVEGVASGFASVVGMDEPPEGL